MKKFSFIDVLIVLVIVAVIAGGFWYLSSKNIIQSSQNTNEVTFDMCVTGLEENVANEINEGDVVYDSAKKIKLGTITNVEKKNESDIYPDNINGGYKKQTVKNRYRVIFTVLTNDGYFEDGILKVNNYELYLGKSCYVKGQNFALSSVVWRLDDVNAKGGNSK